MTGPAKRKGDKAEREALREELRFSWCGGKGYVVEMPDPAAMPCDTCAGTGRRNVEVRDALVAHDAEVAKR